jgi:hypothetical protein
MASHHGGDLDLDAFMDWLHKIGRHVCKELGFKQIVGPASAKLPVPVDGVSLCLDSTDREGRYGFAGSVEALAALGLLAQLSQAMKDLGQDGDYSGFSVKEVEEAMELVDEELANKQLVVRVYKPWVQGAASAS